MPPKKCCCKDCTCFLQGILGTVDTCTIEAAIVSQFCGTTVDPDNIKFELLNITDGEIVTSGTSNDLPFYFYPKDQRQYQLRVWLVTPNIYAPSCSGLPTESSPHVTDHYQVGDCCPGVCPVAPSALSHTVTVYGFPDEHTYVTPGLWVNTELDCTSTPPEDEIHETWSGWSVLNHSHTTPDVKASLTTTPSECSVPFGAVPSVVYLGQTTRTTQQINLFGSLPNGDPAVTTYDWWSTFGIMDASQNPVAAPAGVSQHYLWYRVASRVAGTRWTTLFGPPQLTSFFNDNDQPTPIQTEWTTQFSGATGNVGLACDINANPDCVPRMPCTEEEGSVLCTPKRVNAASSTQFRIPNTGFIPGPPDAYDDTGCLPSWSGYGSGEAATWEAVTNCDTRTGPGPRAQWNIS